MTIAEAVRSFDEYEYLMGIDFGAVTSGFSIAHKKDSFNIYTIKKRNRKFGHIVSSTTHIPTSILYTNDNASNPVIGVSKLDDAYIKREESDIYISNIKQAISDYVLEDRDSPTFTDNLTICNVVADYLKQFHQLAMKGLEEDEEFRASRYFETDFKVANIRYCLACPESFVNFMGQCFIQAEIIKEEELETRLKFVTESDATAYSFLAWDRKSSKIDAEQKYIVCDIGHTALRISKIIAGTTEFFSKVETILEDSELGSMALENNLRHYLNQEENYTRLKLNQAIIGHTIQEFNDNLKFSFYYSRDEEQADDDTETSKVNCEVSLVNIPRSELNTYVFLPYIEKLVKRILNVADDKAIEGKQLFLSGRYAQDSYFSEALRKENNRKFDINDNLADETMTRDFVSRGTVSRGLRKENAQTPYYVGASSDKVFYELKNEEPGLFVNNEGKQSDGNTCDFVVGIDFGTTYTGCSYARFGDTNIKVIDNGWPGRQDNSLGKTPTLLLYDKKNKKINSKRWGQLAKDRSLKDHELLFDKFKLFLSPQAAREFYGEGSETLLKNIADENEQYDQINYSIEEIIAKYLELFKNHAEKYIKSKEKSNSWKLNYVITIPAMWKAAARDTMAQAAITAGIVSKQQLNNLLIISEPEAAALYCESIFVENFKKKDGSTFIVCDAGGGTVDLVTFRFVEDNNGDLVICQVGEGVGDLCGSTYLDKKFMEYLEKFYESIQYVYSTLDFSRAMKDFETEMKPTFSFPGYTDSRFPIKLPMPIPPATIVVPDRNKYHLSDGNTILNMKKQDMMTEVFDPIIEKIETLLKQQIGQLKKDEKIDTILLVGGFSQNRYLQYRLKHTFEPAIAIGIPAEGVKAISKGAVSYALNPRMINKKAVNQSYALEVRSGFDRGKQDDFKKLETTEHGVQLSTSRLTYFVKKGDFAEKDKNIIYEKIVEIEYPKNAIIAIFSCDAVVDEDDKHWRYYNSEHVKLMELNIDMPKVSGKIQGAKIPFKISLKIEHIGVTVKVECQDAEVAALGLERKSEPISTENEKIKISKWKQFKKFILNN